MEFLARIVYARRISQANRIGAAAKMANDGHPEEALERLDKIEKRLHKSLGSVHSLTRGRVLSTLGRIEEAEEAVIKAAKLDPSNERAHLDLAVMSANRGRTEDAKARLKKLIEVAEEEDIREQATELLKNM